MPIFFRHMNNLETVRIICEWFYYHFLKMCVFTTKFWSVTFAEYIFILRYSYEAVRIWEAIENI